MPCTAYLLARFNHTLPIETSGNQPWMERNRADVEHPENGNNNGRKPERRYHTNQTMQRANERGQVYLQQVKIS